MSRFHDFRPTPLCHLSVTDIKKNFLQHLIFFVKMKLVSTVCVSKSLSKFDRHICTVFVCISLSTKSWTIIYTWLSNETVANFYDISNSQSTPRKKKTSHIFNFDFFQFQPELMIDFYHTHGYCWNVLFHLHF